MEVETIVPICHESQHFSSSKDPKVHRAFKTKLNKAKQIKTKHLKTAFMSHFNEVSLSF